MKQEVAVHVEAELFIGTAEKTAVILAGLITSNKMKPSLYQIFSVMMIIAILVCILSYARVYKAEKEWRPRGDEIMYDSSNYQLKVK